MAAREIVFHPEAIAEARAARSWYEDRSAVAGKAFLAELDLAIDRLARAPSTWPSYVAGTRRYLLRRFPFFVVYQELEAEIRVLAVAHARRRPGYWRGRSGEGER